MLSDLDVLYDLAFLLMDLDFRSRRDAGVRVLSAYLDEAARVFPDELWEGLAALPLMLSVRAGVRAHVAAHSGDDALARAYVEAAIAPPLARAAQAGGGGRPVGDRQVHLRAPHRAGPGRGAGRGGRPHRRGAQAADESTALRAPCPTPPTPATSIRGSYDAMIENARTLLKAGHAVVLDATFIDPALRARVEQLALDCGVPFDRRLARGAARGVAGPRRRPGQRRLRRHRRHPARPDRPPHEQGDLAPRGRLRRCGRRGPGLAKGWVRRLVSATGGVCLGPVWALACWKA